MNITREGLRLSRKVVRVYSVYSLHGSAIDLLRSAVGGKRGREEK